MINWASTENLGGNMNIIEYMRFVLALISVECGEQICCI
jgi:hypothetical protein